MTISDYLSQSEKATVQLFESLAFYHDIIKESLPPMYISSRSDGVCDQEEFEQWERDNHDMVQKSLEKQREYFGHTFSQGVICGSIIQIASMGIQTFSSNDSIPDDCSELVAEGSKAVKFCIGRTVRTLPIGLIIYAARNQYNHMDDDAYSQITTNIFDRVAFAVSGGGFKDPAFDLNNQNLRNYGFCSILCG